MLEPLLALLSTMSTFNMNLDSIGARSSVSHGACLLQSILTFSLIPILMNIIQACTARSGVVSCHSLAINEISIRSTVSSAAYIH